MRGLIRCVLIVCSITGCLWNATSGEKDENPEREEAAFLKRITQEPSGRGYDRIRKVQEKADRLIDAYKTSKDADEFLAKLKALKAEVSETDAVEETNRFAAVDIQLDDARFMTIYYDRRTRKLLNYAFGLTWGVL